MKNLLYIVLLLAVLAGAYILYGKNNNSLPTPNEPKATVEYACNEGKSITASFFEDGKAPKVGEGETPVPTGRALVSLSDGRDLDLKQTISADGVRYANEDESLVFWTKGNGALVLENNQEKSYIGCIRVSAEKASKFKAVYQDGENAFTLRLPALNTAGATSSSAYSVEPRYAYNGFGAAKTIYGDKFTIPSAYATGTNLADDSYISVEEIPATEECSALLFLPAGNKVAETVINENDTDYSVASSTDAALGNRYEETVYALPGTNPCVAIRYFLHYGVYENYPEGAIKRFDKAKIISEFDAIRKTLVISQ